MESHAKLLHKLTDENYQDQDTLAILWDLLTPKYVWHYNDNIVNFVLMTSYMVEKIAVVDSQFTELFHLIM